MGLFSARYDQLTVDWTYKAVNNFGSQISVKLVRWSSLRIVFRRPGRQPRLPPLLKIENLAKNHLKKSPLKLQGQLGPNYGGMVFRWSSFRIVSDDPGCQPRWPLLLKIENSAKNHLKIISSETAGPIGPKL